MKNFYPTKEHEFAAKKFVEIFSKDSRVMSILLVCSCARGKACKDSCLDLAIFIKNNKDYDKIEEKFEKLSKSIKEFQNLKKVGKYSEIHLQLNTDKIIPNKRDWTSWPDDFELRLGNTFVYSVVLFDRNKSFERLGKKYLPYYPEKLRKERLKDVKKYLYNNLDHITLYVKRELYFPSFDRLYKASKEFMQALFIKKRIYPVAYDKWVKEQFVEILKMPDLYKEFVDILQIKNFESDEIYKKAEKLRRLAKTYL